MATIAQKPQNWQKDRERWQILLEQLASQVEIWAKDRGWSVKRDQKQISEAHLGTYDAPALTILATSGEVHLDPIARYAVNCDGRVDLLAWPSLNRMLLVRDGTKWKLVTDSGIDWPQEWNKKTFASLVERLHAAA